MNTVTVSPKFQVVIPKEIRQQAGIQPGQKLEVFRIGGVIELAPVKDIRSLRGSLPGLTTEVDRDEEDRVLTLNNPQRAERTQRKTQSTARSPALAILISCRLFILHPSSFIL